MLREHQLNAEAVVMSNMYIGLPYCRAEMYAGRVACCSPVESQWVCRRDRQTNRRTPDRYITFFARRGQRNEQRSLDNVK